MVHTPLIPVRVAVDVPVRGDTGSAADAIHGVRLAWLPMGAAAEGYEQEPPHGTTAGMSSRTSVGLVSAFSASPGSGSSSG